jgi:hypothetical protein
MSTPFVKFIGIATPVASVVASGISLYFFCKASLNNPNEKGFVHHSRGRPSISKKLKSMGFET